MTRMSRGRRCQLAMCCLGAAGVAGLLAPCDARAQGQQSVPGQKVVYMVIKAPATESIEEIKDKFELARRNTGGNFNCDGIVIEPIEAETFGLLNGIVNRGAAAIRDATKLDQSKVIDRVPGERDAWTVDLGGAAFVETATIDVVPAAGSGGESLEVKVGERHPQGLELSFHSPGRYIVRAGVGVRPLRFRCQAVDVATAGGGGQRDVDAEFPPADSGLTYLVTLNGVRGEARFLFDALKDGSKVNNPIQQMGDVPLIVANFVPNEGSFIVDGALVLRFGIPQGENPARLWLFLAPTKAARDAEKERVSGKGFKEMSARIRENQSKSFLPGEAGGWVELSPPRAGAFEGRVVVDVPAWKAAVQAGGGDANDTLLLVYEGDYGGEQRPIRFRTESGSDYIVTEQLPRWLPAIRAAQ